MHNSTVQGVSQDQLEQDHLVIFINKFTFQEGILGNESYAGLVELIHTYMLYGKAWTDPRCKLARRIMGGKHTTQLFKEFLRTHLNGSKLLPEQVHTPLGKANLVWQPPDTQAVLEGHEVTNDK